MSNGNNNTNPMNVWYSKPFDVHIWSDYKEINQVVDQIYDSFTEDEHLAITGRSNNQGRASGKVHLKVIILDLYVAWKTDPELCIGIELSNNAYKVGSRYNALHISVRVATVVPILFSNGWIDLNAGSNNRANNGIGNRTTRIRATDTLIRLFEPIGLEPYELGTNHKQECIILRAADTDAEGNPIKIVKGLRKKTKIINIEYLDSDHPNIIQIRSDLQAYNEFLKETYIDIPDLKRPRIERIRKDGKKQHIQINQNGKFVKRIFSRKSWELNGRFYGGWWQQISKEDRKKIKIDDYPTVEVDYKGLHASILAAQMGMYQPKRDIYSLGRQILPQFDLKKQRQIMKMLVLTAINAKNRNDACSAFRFDSEEAELSRLTNPELNLLLDEFIKLHPYLESSLGSDQGIKLMNLDSQITSIIINKFVEQRRPILSVHDSYIVKTTDVELLRDIMKLASLEVVGTDLSAEQEIPSYGNIMNMMKLDRDRALDTFKQVLGTNNNTEEYSIRLNKFMMYKQRKYSNH